MEVTKKQSLRLGILVSHPIQYYSPWFRDLATKLDLHVFYAHRQDERGQASAGFGVEFSWDIPLLEGYRFTWLKNVASRPGLQTFTGCDTPELYDRISPRDFDALLVIGWNRKSSWQAMRACWKSRVTLLMRGDSQLPMVSSRLKAMIKFLPYRWFLPMVDGHLFVGQRNKEYLKHFGVRDDHLFHCPHFVDNHFFAMRAQESIDNGRNEAIRKQLDIPKDAFVAIFVGKLISKKNPLDFLHAVMNTNESGRPIHAIVVGSGPLEQECRNLTEPCSRIHYAGFQNQTQLPAYYSAADVLVLPSDGTETWGLVVNEAMACGTPCIVSTSCGCSPDLIEDGVSGFVYPENDIARLTAILRQMSGRDIGSLQQARHAAVERVATHSITIASTAIINTICTINDRKRPVSSVQIHSTNGTHSQ